MQHDYTGRDAADELQIVLYQHDTQAMTRREVDQQRAERRGIGTLLVDLASRNRLSIVLVEHDLEFVRRISSRVIVLHQGSIVLDGGVEDAVTSDTVRTIYAGAAHG